MTVRSSGEKVTGRYAGWTATSSQLVSLDVVHRLWVYPGRYGEQTGFSSANPSTRVMMFVLCGYYGTKEISFARKYYNIDCIHLFNCVIHNMSSTFQKRINEG